MTGLRDWMQENREAILQIAAVGTGSLKWESFKASAVIDKSVRSFPLGITEGFAMSNASDQYISSVLKSSFWSK